MSVCHLKSKTSCNYITDLYLWVGVQRYPNLDLPTPSFPWVPVCALFRSDPGTKSSGSIFWFLLTQGCRNVRAGGRPKNNQTKNREPAGKRSAERQMTKIGHKSPVQKKRSFRPLETNGRAYGNQKKPSLTTLQLLKIRRISLRFNAKPNLGIFRIHRTVIRLDSGCFSSLNTLRVGKSTWNHSWFQKCIRRCFQYAQSDSDWFSSKIQGQKLIAKLSHR